MLNRVRSPAPRALAALLVGVVWAVVFSGCSVGAPVAPTGLEASAGHIWARAYEIPKHTTNQSSGYFSIVEGHNGRLYIGTAKYGVNAYLVEFDPATERMRVVVDAHQEIGTSANGFAAQSKIHTRNNVGRSGRIYFATKQGYPQKDEKRTDYPGGYPMVYDPVTGSTRVYDIPVPHQGIISIAPDESRGLAYISTCSDERPTDGAHFLVLDLQTGRYRDLGDLRHMYAFIVVDWLGRAYHPILGGEIGRYDPLTGKLERLKQTIDGQTPDETCSLTLPSGNLINWEISPDRKTLYALAMNDNQLYAYDLTAQGGTLPGRRLGALIPDAERTDCRAMCVGATGEVWAAVAAGSGIHLVSYRSGDAAPKDHGLLVIRNPDYTSFTDENGEELPWRHGMKRTEDGAMVPIYPYGGICRASDGTVYVTVLCPYTLLKVEPATEH